MGDRPVRWAALAGDYDGRDRTLEVFNADATAQLGLLEAIADEEPALAEAAGGPIVIVFHTTKATASRYAAFLREFEGVQPLSSLAGGWAQEGVEEPAIDGRL
jgi:hypothetical protein